MQLTLTKVIRYLCQHIQKYYVVRLLQMGLRARTVRLFELLHSLFSVCRHRQAEPRDDDARKTSEEEKLSGGAMLFTGESQACDCLGDEHAYGLPLSSSAAEWTRTHVSSSGVVRRSQSTRSLTLVSRAMQKSKRLWMRLK